jgi:hypothetical protein
MFVSVCVVCGTGIQTWGLMFARQVVLLFELLHQPVCLFLKQGFAIIAQDGLRLIIFLPELPECWEYMLVLPCPASLT